MISSKQCSKAILVVKFKQSIRMKSNRRIRGTTPEVEEAARKLRENLTLAEARLWEALSNKQLDGLRFCRQHPVGNFILDFYCPAYKLVVEIDGKIDDRQTEYDNARTNRLAEYGYKDYKI
ncbi:hypothetical protein NIES4102_09020 [Chondrocystis sp. NIES-4102]|nr:hypothetical protein NIES4102_09020 [Chondrocystis sp. NIES-4102]